MRNVLNLIEKNRSIKKKMIFAFLILSVLVVTLIISFLIRPAYSAVNKADCGVAEHIHTSQCYSEHKNYGESVLVCSSDLSSELLSHIHDDFCYDENGKIICPLSEYQHVHTDDCYDENGVQICGTAYHQHGKECFRVLDENESALVLDCGRKAHVHVDSCYPELSSASLEKMQVDFEETQNIEPDFEEAEIIESEMELYEPEIDNGIALLNDENSTVASSDGYVLKTANISSVILQYKDAKGRWITVTENMTGVPANADMRIEVNYKDVKNNDIVNNTIIYNGIPAWLNPDSTGNIYDEDGNVVASLSVADGKAVITFDPNYLSNKSTIEGSFSVEGSADWHKIDTPSTPTKPLGFNFNFTFENDLAAKYGNFKVKKSHDAKLVEVRDNDGNITNTYLKYELKVTSLESDKDIPNITITDVLSTEKWLNLSDVIVDNGYIGVTTTETELVGSANSQNPYETLSDVNTTHGKVVLDNNNLKWEFANLKSNEVRTLVYYVELNEKYVGSGSAGTLRNEAKPESNGFKKESVRDEFIPKADVDISKTQVSKNINDYGNGTITYTIEVTAKDTNSYTITDACIKDAFGSGMGNYVVGGQKVNVTITKGNVTSNYEATVGSEGFNVPVDKLEPGETVTITYSLQVQHLYSYENGTHSFTNHASFIGSNKNEKLKKGYTFKGSGATTWVTHNQWMRKMNGITVPSETTITFTNNGSNVYNYDKSKSDTTSFTVPQNAQEYTVIVNEDGTWDMSGAGFHDNFTDQKNRVLYTGYLKIDEFDQVSGIGVANNLRDDQVLTALNGQNPTKTVWVNIDGRNSFDIIPTNYELTNANKVYRLTYYAAVSSNVTNVKNILVANEFTITGNIGIGDKYITLGGFKTVVSSTLTGSASYDFDKESLFYEKVYNHEYNGEIYWLIRANGTLTKGMHIQDIPDSTIRPDSILNGCGVYLGNKNYDFSTFTSFKELNTALSKMEKRECGTSSYSYDLQPITNLNDLNGQEFAIFSKGVSYSGYMMSSIVHEYCDNGIKGEHLNNSSPLAANTSVNTNDEVQTWHFDRVGTTDKFHIYYIDSSGKNQYLHINGQNNVFISDEQNELTVDFGADGQIKITNSAGMLLNWYGGNATIKNCYSAWDNNEKDGNNWHYLGKLNQDNSHIYDYSWSVNSNRTEGNFIINKDTVIPQDKSLYIVLRTYPSQALPEIESKTFNNSIEIVDDANGHHETLDNASYIYTPNLPLRKEGMVAAYWDGQKWDIKSVSPKDTRNTIEKLKAHFDQNDIVNRNGKGLYADWLMNVNWDGSLETLEDEYVILTDHLDHKMEPLIVRQFWIPNDINTEDKKPSYHNIPELDDDPMWKQITSQTNINDRPDVPFYYNETTGEIKIAVGNLQKSVGTNNSTVNLQLICRVTDPNVIFSGDVSTLTNKADLTRPDGTFIGKQEVDHLINPTYSISKTVNGTADEGEGDNKTHRTNKLTYTIEINPQSENLIDGDTLPVLIDKMTGKMELIGDINVYKDSVSADNLLDNIDLSIEKKENITTIEFKNLPDQTHLIIEYKAKVNVDASKDNTDKTEDISNIAYWEGYDKPSSPQHSETFKYTLSGYVSSKSYADVVIKKCDFNDNSITLGGAQFEIREVNADGTVSSTAITATTDNNGKIHFDSSSTNNLNFNKVYQIKETQAPTDYVLDETPKYFIIINDEDNKIPSYIIDGKMKVVEDDVDVIIEYAVKDEIDLELTIYNEKAHVEVNKVFLDESGEPIDSENVDFYGTYRFGLYYYPATSPKAKCEQILSITYSETEISFALDGKKTDKPEFTKANAGKMNYVYELNEKNEPITNDAYLNGYLFYVTYSSNSVFAPQKVDLTEPQVTVTNKYHPIYMPSAGGIGLKSYYKISFFALMILSTLTAAVFRVRRKHK